MASFDDLAPQFHRAKDRWPDASLLSQHYESVVESYDGSGLNIITIIKSFIECVCRTILGECGKPEPISESSTTYLLREALKALGLENSRGASKLDDVLSAHNKMTDALSFMRNNHDPGAHGKDGFLDTLTTNETRAYLITADSILAFLLAAHEGTEPDLRYTREPYEQFARFHDRVDHAVSIEALVDVEGDVETLVVMLRTSAQPEGIEIRLEPSKLLYEVDRTAYVELLKSSTKITQSLIEAEAVETLPVDAMSFEPAAQTIPIPEVVTSYDGTLSGLKPALETFLQSLGGLEGAAATGTNLCDSLLATAERSMGLDWRTREPLQAAIKVALRRTLIKFGIEANRAEHTAERLMVWLRTNADQHEEEAINA